MLLMDFNSPRLFFVLMILLVVAVVRTDSSDFSTNHKDIRGSSALHDCEQSHRRKERDISATRVSNYPDEQDIDIIATYSDTSGNIRLARMKTRDLSDSWIWENHVDGDLELQKSSETLVKSFHASSTFGENPWHSVDERYSGEIRENHPRASPLSPVMTNRRIMRQERRKARAAQLIQQEKETDSKIVAEVIERAEGFVTTVKGKFSIWRREYENPNSDSTLKLMRDQIIMAKAYTNIAMAENKTILYNALIKQSRESQLAIGEASSDAELCSWYLI